MFAFFLNRDAEVLKDRDLSGELKDIWGAVQAKRLREKDSAPSYESYLATQNQIYIDFGPPEAPPYQLNTNNDHQQHQQDQPGKIISEKECNQLNSVLNYDEVDNNLASRQALQIAVGQQSVEQIENNSQSTSNNSPHRTTAQNNSNGTSITTTASVSSVSSATTTTALHTENDSNKNDRTVTKKDKLSGFLPNGCHNIFPFIKTKSNSHDKNNAHKEKNNDNNIQQTNQKEQQQHSSNGSRKIPYKDNNKFIQNCDTANLESAISKLDIGKP